MNDWLLFGAALLVGLLTFIGLFFFVLTRGALLYRSLFSGATDDAAHIYPIYSDMRLIKLVDWQPVISAILLFHYHRLVSKIVAELDELDLGDRKVMITSCAFGNVIPRVVASAVEGGAARVLVADLIPNELIHAESKLGALAERVEFLDADATAMRQADGVVAANVIFFLLHELPDPMKGRALDEAGRLLAPGGKLLLAEFHRPYHWPLRALSWTYFKVFEPLGLALWDTHDPLRHLERGGGWRCERETYCYGNFQVITATKL